MILGDLIRLIPRVRVVKRLLHKNGIVLGKFQKCRLHVFKIRLRLAHHHFRHIQLSVQSCLLNSRGYNVAPEMLLPAFRFFKHIRRWLRRGLQCLKPLLHFREFRLRFLTAATLPNNCLVIELGFFDGRRRRALCFALGCKFPVRLTRLRLLNGFNSLFDCRFFCNVFV